MRRGVTALDCAHPYVAIEGDSRVQACELIRELGGGCGPKGKWFTRRGRAPAEEHELCHQQGCEQFAATRCHWPGQPELAFCAVHILGARNAAAALGFVLATGSLLDEGPRPAREFDSRSTVEGASEVRAGGWAKWA